MSSPSLLSARRGIRCRARSPVGSGSDAGGGAKEAVPPLQDRAGTGTLPCTLVKRFSRIGDAGWDVRPGEGVTG